MFGTRPGCDPSEVALALTSISRLGVLTQPHRLQITTRGGNHFAASRYSEVHKEYFSNLRPVVLNENSIFKKQKEKEEIKNR